MKPIITTIVATALLWPTMAHAEFKGCYERVYDKAYLRKHKKQLITKIRFQYGVGKAGESPQELLDSLDAVFRTTSLYKGNLAVCKTSSDQLKCGLEADGGSFTVTDRGDNSIRITNETYLHFGDDESKLTVEAKGEHKLFRLYRISEGACP
jgi:hypothetical protein